MRRVHARARPEEAAEAPDGRGEQRAEPGRGEAAHVLREVADLEQHGERASDQQTLKDTITAYRKFNTVLQSTAYKCTGTATIVQPQLSSQHAKAAVSAQPDLTGPCARPLALSATASSCASRCLRRAGFIETPLHITPFCKRPYEWSLLTLALIHR